MYFVCCCGLSSPAEESGALFQESKRAYVSPARIDMLHHEYWKQGKVSVCAICACGQL